LRGLDRPTVEARLERLVTENRFTIAVVFPAAGAVLLVASAEGALPPALSFSPYLILLGTLVMRLPLVAGIAPLTDRRAGLALAALTVYAYAIEYVGLRTGWPYGSFTYGVDLGPVIGGVPVGLPLFFVPLVVDGLLLSVLVLGARTRRWTRRVPLAVGFVILIDLVLDPAAVAIEFWHYTDGGYYGVPWSNYGGWLLSATVAVSLLDWGLDCQGLIDRMSECSYLLDDILSFVLLWGTINAVVGQWIPVLLALGLGAILYRTGRLDLRWPRGLETVQRDVTKAD